MIKELEDYSWFPQLLRRYQADYIGSIVKWLEVYRPLITELEQLIEVIHPQIIQDLCSGSGIPAIYMQKHVKNISQTILSDKYPNGFLKNDSESTYIKESTDALELIPLRGVCYTMYNSFHHFSAVEQKELVKKMTVNKNAFLFAEILQPGILTTIRIIFAATILQLFTAPFVKPFSLKRLLFTYIIPVNLLTVLYDGVISVLKSRSYNYYRHLVEDISDNDFTVSVVRYHNWKGALIFIKGNPAQS
jgi:hypothetical protein